MKEINSLAIVTMAGVDKDPDTGEFTAYYQVINPTGLSTRIGSTSRAAVYTFNFKDYSIGKFSEKTGMSMPRRFFTPHLQTYIISERYARSGILDILNFVELSPERRSNVILLVTDSPMYKVMNSFTSLERVPGRFIRDMTSQYKPNFSMSNFPIRFKDFAKQMNRHTPIVVPIVHYNGENPSSKTSRLEQIDATRDGMSYGRAAVFIQDRMVGAVSEQMKNIFFIINSKYRQTTETFKVNGSLVDVQAANIHVKRKWVTPGSRMVIEVHTDLHLLNNQQKNKMTLPNIHDIEAAFDLSFGQRLTAFERLSKDKGWDLLGIQDNGGNTMTWHETEVTFQIHSRLTTIGNSSTPYTLE
ncbi:Ger(x)C family spore germination C-terminal domain-containing protein [Cohnella lupini]|nr:Ger(x)C family spore germination C-terminal domain-containing protein [Cohnella lupini]